MSANDQTKAHDWSDDPQLTAYAFGELEAAEARDLEARIEGDDAAQQVLEELRSFGLTLEESFAQEPAPALSDEQRQRIEARAGGQDVLTPMPANQAPAWGWRPKMAIAATVVVAGLGTAFVVSQQVFRGDMAPGHLGDEAMVARSSVPINAVADAPTGYTKPASSEDLRMLEALGYRSGAPETETAAGEALPGTVDRLRSLGYVGDESLARAAEGASRPGAKVRHELKGLGYVGGDRGERRSDGRRVLGESLEEAELDLERRQMPKESSREAYDHLVENDFLSATQAPLSTFSIDVDTASYANMRRFLNQGQLPPADAIRIEELVNYFTYDYAAPTGEHPFSVNLEAGSAPWKPQHRLVRIGLAGRETLAEERQASNLVFLLDVSGSMNNADKLPLLKKALQMLVQELDERDTVSIVVYAGASGVVLPATNCDRSVEIHMALERLKAGGSTNGGAGIELAYKMAAANFIKGGINRVILATDGDFNVGVSDDGSLVRLIEEKAKTGVFLSVLGFGSGNLQDAKMEKLADKGNGNYAYIDSTREARKVLVEQMGATLETIAKDVKIQVEFNPKEVQAYRLIGYENRLMAAQDFYDNTKDAGEIGAGHTVTALYEVVPVGVPFETTSVDPLKYQTPSGVTNEAFSGELLTVKFRYKRPDGETDIQLSETLRDEGEVFEEMSADSRFAASVASFGMLLRGSKYAGNADLGKVASWAMQSAGEDPGGYRAQFVGLVSKARELKSD